MNTDDERSVVHERLAVVAASALAEPALVGCGVVDGNGDEAQRVPAEGPEPSPTRGESRREDQQEESTDGSSTEGERADGAGLEVVPELVREVQPSVVAVLAGLGEGPGVVHPSGGVVVTDDHVVEGSDEVQVAFADGDRVAARVVVAGARRRGRALGPLAAAACALVLAAGCGGGGASEPEAQPAPDVSVFAEGDFGEIPLHPRSDPIGPRSEKAGVTARSYVTRGATPEQVLRYYEGNLDGWALVEPVRRDHDAYRGTWERDGRTLLVSAGPAPTVDTRPGDAGQVLTQYNLQLGPA